MTTEPLTAAPACRHLLTVSGGTLACTLPAEHPGTVHADGDTTAPEGGPIRWRCKDPATVPPSRVTVCSTFQEYETE